MLLQKESCFILISSKEQQSAAKPAVPAPLPPVVANDVLAPVPPVVANDVPVPVLPVVANDVSAPVPHVVANDVPAPMKPCFAPITVHEDVRMGVLQPVVDCAQV